MKKPTVRAISVRLRMVSLFTMYWTTGVRGRSRNRKSAGCRSTVNLRKLSRLFLSNTHAKTVSTRRTASSPSRYFHSLSVNTWLTPAGR